MHLRAHSVSTGSLPFSLQQCLESGQSFAWRYEDPFWVGTIRSTAFVLKQVDHRIEYEYSSCGRTDPEETLREYFGLNDNSAKICETFPENTFLREAIRFSPGLRILRQDPWECLCGFILSSTKQIVHIQQIWRKLSLRWGKELTFPTTDSKKLSCTIHAFPTPESLAEVSEIDLRGCGMGFRAPYIRRAAMEVNSKALNLESLRLLSTESARDQLLRLPGVGEKIADCVLLFSLGKWDAFPVDTWILKVLKNVYFPRKRKISIGELREFARTHFGPYGGYAQQYLFHYARMNAELFH